MYITEIDQQRQNVLLRLLFKLSLLVFILLSILWLYMNFYELLFVGLVASCMFVINLFLLKKKKHLLSLQIGIVTIVGASIAETFFLGWNSYFTVYLIASAIIVINSTSIRLNLKIFEVIIIMILFAVCLIFTSDGYHIYSLDSKLTNGIGLFNLLVAIFLILFMEFNNFIENDKLKNKVVELSEIDPLTGAYNRRFFNNYLDIEIKRQKSLLKYSHSREVNFGIAVIDIDDFKDVNDNYGHLVGDAVLLEVAETIKAIIFERDILCRYGGEEFVVLFTSTPKSGVMIAIEKILGTIENHKFMINRENSKIIISITVSIGFASFDEDVNIYKLLEIADKRLYIAKETGKNRVVYE